jgi:hypothetical protein
MTTMSFDSSLASRRIFAKKDAICFAVNPNRCESSLSAREIVQCCTVSSVPDPNPGRYTLESLR